MYARSTTLGILALATAALTGGSTPNYALSSTGAVQVYQTDLPPKVTRCIGSLTS